jgi:aryl-alcohol dehydrogenase-like predicted oxidoreductase
MEKVQFAKSKDQISPICLGCMSFGKPDPNGHTWTLDYAQSKDIIEKALQAGINFFDTAPVYSNGTREEYLGRALKELGAKREDLFIATKFFPRTPEEIENNISMKEHISSWLSASLKRLDMDYVDLYILHKWDFETPIEETLEALASLKAEGKIRHIGISNAYAWQVARANEIAKSNGWPTFESIQSHYNLLMREEEREMNPYARSEGMQITPYSALAAGRLSRKPGQSSNRLEKDAFAKFKYDAAANLDTPIIERVYSLSEQKGCSMSSIALAWLMAKGAVPIAGATKPSHIEGFREACSILLSQEEIDYLEELYEPHRLSGVMAQYPKM